MTNSANQLILVLVKFLLHIPFAYEPGTSDFPFKDIDDTEP